MTMNKYLSLIFFLIITFAASAIGGFTTFNISDEKLKNIMFEIHKSCLIYGKEKNYVNYVKGANIAGFVKVADAMIAQGVV